MSKRSIQKEETLDLNIAKNYVFTLIEQTLKEMNLTFTTMQSFQAEMYILEYLDRCLKEGYKTLTSEASAKFVIAGILKTIETEKIKKAK